MKNTVKTTQYVSLRRAHGEAEDQARKDHASQSVPERLLGAVNKQSMPVGLTTAVGCVKASVIPVVYRGISGCIPVMCRWYRAIFGSWVPDIPVLLLPFLLL